MDSIISKCKLTKAESTAEALKCMVHSIGVVAQKREWDGPIKIKAKHQNLSSSKSLKKTFLPLSRNIAKLKILFRTFCVTP